MSRSKLSVSDQKTVKLSILEAQRDEKRRRLEDLFLQHQLVQQQMKDVENELLKLDKEIDDLERELTFAYENETSGIVVKEEAAAGQSNFIISEGRLHLTQTQADEVLTDPMTLTMNAEESLTDPATPQNVSSTRPLPARVSAGTTQQTKESHTFLLKPPPHIKEQLVTTDSHLPLHAKEYAQTMRETESPVVLFANEPSRSVNSGGLTPAPARVPETAAGVRDPNAYLKADTFPWSQRIYDLLRNTFQIQSFRDHQKEIINATLSGNDVFVIMRTGGGKSLTYQLPALLEGRGPQRKVTFVISPLLSLIQDQEEQMNNFAPGSAISFTSGMKGGTTEHARRWGLVRDPSQGVCLVFVTPEKVNKSSKLRNEMEKLMGQGRLGRFVIDEAHCACQWGHDFRPDYAQLGLLKSHFPSIPVIAVTATASDRVREDVCKILRLGDNYRFFRSTANRPNLRYTVRPKPDAKQAIIEDMVNFIREEHGENAGIVYTFSRKDADTVADMLCENGIVARPYHSDITPTEKELVHRSWMRNETQVVVATIAFGLGINKPDVRFVLHHTISKTLEAYYQESGRAGRDGEKADCVLYYSPKDVPRMARMVHGKNEENLLWPMVRYGQENGNDAVCRATILKHLGEPDCPDIEIVQSQNEGVTNERRDIGRHAQTVARLLHLRLEEGENVTLAMLVKDWRAKSGNAPQCVRDFPPSVDNLSVCECERIVIAMLLNGIFHTNIVWTAYDSVLYLKLGTRGYALLSSSDPHMIIRLPKRGVPSKASKPARTRKVSGVGEWISAKPKATKKSKTSKAKAKRKTPGAKVSTKTSKKTRAKGKDSSKINHKDLSEIIELSSDDEKVAVERSYESKEWEAEKSGSEYEFDG